MIDFSKLETSDSKFLATLSDTGGYITFSNSGKGNTRKYFTLGLAAFIQMLEDILNNIDTFSGHENYNEKIWRDLGAALFTDPTANAQITVQTKPVFSTLSKVIGWANPHLLGNNFEDIISLDIADIKRTLSKLRALESTYSPSDMKTKEQSFSLFAKTINGFALRVFKHFYENRWEELISSGSFTESTLGDNPYKALTVDKFRALLARFDTKQDIEALTSANTRRYFEDEIFIDDLNHHYYFSTQWNGKGDYSLSFKNLKAYFESKFPEYTLIQKNSGYELISGVAQTITADQSDLLRLPKPFILLAGISGTGKTRFVREQAISSSLGEQNLCVLPVRPDWHDPSDLLGYISRLGDKPKYVSTEVLEFVIEAWKSIAPNADANGMGDLNESAPPYWLCLDEMNLAPVEQYFADYLSVLESRKFNGRTYSCDALLSASVLETSDADIRADLGLNDDPELWGFFLTHGIPLPPNLIVAGTVNMDETTHGFSRKVIDRALTLDFGEFFPNDYSKFFEGQAIPKVLTYSLSAQAVLEDMNCPADKDAQKTIGFLTAVNSVLKGTPFELAYRALNELLLFVGSFAPENDSDLQAVWDDYLMTKVLPRIDGDEDKLRITVPDGGSNNLLTELQEQLAKQLFEIWPDEKSRLDLFREDSNRKAINDVKCRSKKKIQWMKNRLDANTFTSFWP